MENIRIKEYDENNNLIHYKNSYGFEYWREYDGNNNKIHFKDSDGFEYWWKWENNLKIKITQKEFEKIKNKKSRELINNSKISRFGLMDI